MTRFTWHEGDWSHGDYSAKSDDWVIMRHREIRARHGALPGTPRGRGRWPLGLVKTKITEGPILSQEKLDQILNVHTAAESAVEVYRDPATMHVIVITDGVKKVYSEEALRLMPLDELAMIMGTLSRTYPG